MKHDKHLVGLGKMLNNNLLISLKEKNFHNIAFSSKAKVKKQPALNSLFKSHSMFLNSNVLTQSNRQTKRKEMVDDHKCLHSIFKSTCNYLTNPPNEFARHGRLFRNLKIQKESFTINFV